MRQVREVLRLKFVGGVVKGNSVAIYGPEGSRGSLHDVLAGQMEFTYFPVELNQLPAAITYYDLTECIDTIGGARVATEFLHHPAMTVGREIARRMGVAASTVRATIRRFQAAGLSWPLSEETTDAVLEAKLFRHEAGLPSSD
jgi:hypothetical protein